MRAIAAPVRRTRVRVTGTVQGVGFRPHAYRLARALALSGYVRNDTHGVELEVQGAPAAVDAFLVALREQAPPLAVLDSVRCEERAPSIETDARFAIVASDAEGRPDAPVTPDSATCADCLAELTDPADRRHRYPFINCTNCGPRFTIVRGVPYDRPMTSMAGFAMCAACQAEYDDPGDRRFHAQPNACPLCGPRASFTLLPGGSAVGGSGSAGDPAGGSGSAGDPVRAAARALAEGGIVAVKGIGGYHLACRADAESVVARLRDRKHREDKPFALMAASAAVAAQLVAVSAGVRDLLQSPARPIVLAPRRDNAPVAPSVAPGAAELGVMLPYTPLHHLLLADLAEAGVHALVLTSGNVSDEPIAFDDDDACARLAGIAEAMLWHDREIVTRTDDSVVRAAGADAGARPLVIRRSRGYVPAALALPGGTPRPLLACGAELKHTFCLARDERAWVSHHIGDLANYETLRSFVDGAAHFEQLFAVAPEVLVHDLHPDYLSTAYARNREEVGRVELIGVQHHHAHLAACLAEHGVAPGEPAVGAIYDGTGYGTDATVWGGELLCGDASGFVRAGHLWPTRLPGGEAAIRAPWRMACAWLHEAGGLVSGPPARLRGVVSERDWALVSELVASGFRAPVTSSMGRLLDGLAALCGIRPTVTYEGQAAIEFEAEATRAWPLPGYDVAVGADAEGSVVIDPRSMVRAVLDDLEEAVPVEVVAARVHMGLAEASVEACARVCSAASVGTVVLSGGVFQNRLLLGAVREGLTACGLRALVPERLPAGDGGIAYGQAAVAAAALRSAW